MQLSLPSRVKLHVHSHRIALAETFHKQLTCIIDTCDDTCEDVAVSSPNYFTSVLLKPQNLLKIRYPTTRF